MFSLSFELKFGSPDPYPLADLDRGSKFRGAQIRQDTGTFNTFASDLSPKNQNFIENIMIIDRPTEVKVVVM